MAAHVAWHVLGHGLRLEAPHTVETAKAIFVAIGPHRLQWKVCDLLEHDDVRTAHRSSTGLVDLDDRIADDVTSVRGTGVGVTARVAFVHLLDGGGAHVGTAIPCIDRGMGEQPPDALEVAAIDELGIAVDEIEHGHIVLGKRHDILSAMGCGLTEAATRREARSARNSRSRSGARSPRARLRDSCESGPRG